MTSFQLLSSSRSSVLHRAAAATGSLLVPRLLSPLSAATRCAGRCGLRPKMSAADLKSSPFSTTAQKQPLVRDTFCSFCGTRHTSSQYPRTCPGCHTSIWANPIPVSVVLAPIRTQAGRTGLMVIRRGIQPGLGKLALAGGFLEEHETWQQGGAREIEEEAGVKVDSEGLKPLWFTSTQPRPNRVLLFSTSPVIEAASLPAFTANHETSERGVLFGPEGIEEIMAFPLHAEAVRRFFSEQKISGKHDYTVL